MFLHKRTCPQGHVYESIASSFVVCRTCREVEKVNAEGNKIGGDDRALAFELAERLADAYGIVEEYQRLQVVNDMATEIESIGRDHENAELTRINRDLIEQNLRLIETVAGYKDAGNQALDIGERAAARDKALNGASHVIASAVRGNVLAREAEATYLRLESAARATVVYLQHMKLQLAETLAAPLRELDHARNPRNTEEEDISRFIRKANGGHQT